MLDMKVTGLVLLTVSITYTTTTAIWAARASVMMFPLADQVNTYKRYFLINVIFVFISVLNHLNLSGGVDDDELILLGPHQLQHLVKLGGEQVEAGHDAAVRTQLVLFHYYREKIRSFLSQDKF